VQDQRRAEFVDPSLRSLIPDWERLHANGGVPPFRVNGSGSIAKARHRLRILPPSAFVAQRHGLGVVFLSKAFDRRDRRAAPDESVLADGGGVMTSSRICRSVERPFVDPMASISFIADRRF
jgi:hypothetical protein